MILQTILFGLAIVGMIAFIIHDYRKTRSEEEENIGRLYDTYPIDEHLYEIENGKEI